MVKHSINTMLVHAGERKEPPTGRPVTTPIYPSVTYTYESMEVLSAALDGETADHTYARYGNPTVAALDELMRTVENGVAAQSFGSGMAAMHAALLACGLETGSTVLASQDLYGATFALIENVFGPFGVTTEKADFNDLPALAAAAERVKPKALIAETISNPVLKICDIDAVAAIAHEHGARLIVDSTFASPFLCRPLDHAADLVMHSTTKYLSGHGDSTGGVVVSRHAEDIARLESIKRLVGGILSPYEAYEVIRGMKTLALRQQRQCENAAYLAERLKRDPRISRVYYPNFTGDDSVLKRMLREPFGGGLVTIELAAGTREAAFRFMNALQLCVRATSLGDVQTLVSHPATSSHRGLSAEEREAIKITEGMVRFSVGIEGVEDLAADIDRALILV